MYKFNFHLSKTSLPEILNTLSLFLLNLKFLRHRAWNLPLGTELPKSFEGNQILREWDSSSRSLLVRESVRYLVPLASWEHGCNAGLDGMVSTPFSEENVLLLQYLKRLQVRPRDKSLNNPKSRRTASTRNSCQVCTECVCKHSTHEDGCAWQGCAQEPEWSPASQPSKMYWRGWRSGMKYLCNEHEKVGADFSILFLCVSTQNSSAVLAVVFSPFF